MGRTRDLANLPQEIAVDGSGNVAIGGGTLPAGMAGKNALIGERSVVGELPSGGSLFANNLYYDGADWKYKVTDVASLAYFAGGTVAIYRAASGTADATATLNLTATFDASGNFLVGTTTYRTGKVGIEHAGASQYGMQVQNTDTSGSSQYAVQFSRGSSATEVGKITTTSTATAYTTSSDYRLKENVQPISGALAKVAALNPCTYTWKATGEAGEGFIAHELQAVVPDAVTGEKDAVNEDGSIKPQGIDTSFLVATLVAAIQELKAEVDALKGE